MDADDVMMGIVCVAIGLTSLALCNVLSIENPDDISLRKQNYELFVNVTKHNISYEQYCYMSQEERAAFIARGNK